MISHLKQQIEKLRDFKEQVVVLKAERDHLENKVKTLNEKVKYLSTPVIKYLFLKLLFIITFYIFVHL